MLLLIATTLESAVAVVLLREYVADYTLISVFVRLLAANIALAAIYKVFIYPFFVSPLRHLPGPKVSLLEL